MLYQSIYQQEHLTIKLRSIQVRIITINLESIKDSKEMIDHCFEMAWKGFNNRDSQQLGST